MRGHAGARHARSTSNSEKYEIKAWDWDRPGNISDYIAQLNRIRRDNPALHLLDNLRFYKADNENILFYGKMTPARDNIVLVAVNLDPHYAHTAKLELPWEEMGAKGAPYLEAESLAERQRAALAQADLRRGAGAAREPLRHLAGVCAGARRPAAGLTCSPHPRSGWGI